MDISFTKHPTDVGETYSEHLMMATSFGTAMILGGLACLVHGILPFLFTSTGSSTIKRLHDRMVVSRRAGCRRACHEAAALTPSRALARTRERQIESDIHDPHGRDAARRVRTGPAM